MKRRLPIHYGWVIAAAGMAGVMACLGFGRFALGMLLPSMGASLGLSYSEMGFIGTGNFVGYMVSVALAGAVVRRLGFRVTVSAALFLVAVSMVLVSRSGGFVEILVFYFLTGVGAAFSNVPLMGLSAHWFNWQWRGRAAGIIVSGCSLGVIASAVLVPAINQAVGAEGWRLSWLIFGGISAVVAIVCLALLRNKPADVGLRPFGDDGDGDMAPRPQRPAKPRKALIVQLGVIFLLFGFTYSIYTTFIVTTLVDEYGVSEGTAGQFWAWVGFLSLFSGPLFGTVSDRMGRKAGFAIIFLLHTAAYLLVAFDPPMALLYLSIGLFGITAWSIPAVMMATVGDYAGPAYAAATLGAITVFFGVGQIGGPAVAGIIADVTGSFAGSYLMAAAFTAVAVVCSLFLRRPAITY